jgi:micrococcal nuclease
MRGRRLLGPRWLWRLRRRLTWVFILLVGVPALLDAGVGALHPMADGGDTCRIVQVVDGDTLTLWCTGQGTLRARLTGFDAPELFSPQCFTEVVAAQRAKWALRLMVLRATDLQMRREGTDRYGRSLLTLSDAAGPLADRMISSGQGRVYSGGRRNGWCTGAGG